MFCSGLRACQVHALEQGPRLSSLIDSPISPLPRAWLIEMESERGVRKDRGAFSATHLLPKSVQTDCEVTAEGHHGGVTVSEPWCPHEALLSFPSRRVQPTATHLSPWPHDLGYGHGGHLCTRLSLPTRPLTGTGCWSGRWALQTPVCRSDAALASPRPCQLGAVLGELLSRSGGGWGAD